MAEYLKPKILQPVSKDKLRETVREYLAAWKSGDGKEIARMVRLLNQVGFSKAGRQAEIERQAKGDVELEAALARVKDQLKASIEARQTYLQNRPWRLDAQLADIANAGRKWWQRLD